jgi:hypothetical protein
MQWKHAFWALFLIPLIAAERAVHRLWGWVYNLRSFVWRRLTDCTCVKPGSSCGRASGSRGRTRDE